MKNRLLTMFSLFYEKEAYETVIQNIDGGVVFRGTKLWILIFAIFVASLGLNVNSTAVIIGAMLISPLMGPIMGIGLSMGINDVQLLRKSIFNFLIASSVALITSTIFFVLSPINDAHSEILARTSPTIYDVLIALFGGFAGIIATTSKQKGNVIPGVAIATALMPPLCTAGYGLATLQFSYFFGSFYLFIINTVFIALSTLIIVRLLHFPHKHLQNIKTERIAKRVIGLVVILTLLPSIYFGYDMVQQNKFEKKANWFIVNEAHFTNDYLLNKKINAKNKNILLVFGGKEIQTKEIDELKNQLKKYDLENASLEIKQGFAYLTDNNQKNNQVSRLTQALIEKESRDAILKFKVDSINELQTKYANIYAELKVLHPTIKSAIIEPTTVYMNDSTKNNRFLVLLNLSQPFSNREKKKMETWLKIRLSQQNTILIIQP